MFVVVSRSLTEVENTSTVQKDDRIMEMKRNAEGKDNRIIELESRYCDMLTVNTFNAFPFLSYSSAASPSQENILPVTFFAF